MLRASHRKMAFLLEKVSLVILGIILRVRLGCVWVQLAKLIHIVTSVIWEPVIKGKNVAWRLHMQFI
jgi:hypothetical protein